MTDGSYLAYRHREGEQEQSEGTVEEKIVDGMYEPWPVFEHWDSITRRER